MYGMVKENLLRIREEIEPCQPRIIAVTKYYDANAIVSAYEAGLRDFGESRAIEACQKIDSLPQEIRQNSQFHFIGHLQTNKVRNVVGVFDYIHSVDSLKLAQCISQAALNKGIIQKILIQINNACEEQKFGFSKTDVYENFEKIKQLEGIKISGLMDMAPLGAEERELHSLFAEIRQIRDDLEKQFDCSLPELSMGMSQDYKIAAQEGSTMLRIGRKLFT